MRRLARPFWFLLAVLFLAEAWLWELFAALWARVLARIPLDALRAALSRAICRLPAAVALLVFVIPGLVLLPFKVAGLWLIGTGHPFAGLATFMAAKTAGLGSAAFLYEATRPKLMELAWFRRVQEAVSRARIWARRQTEPFRSRIREIAAAIRRAVLARGGVVGRMIRRLRARARRPTT